MAQAQLAAEVERAIGVMYGEAPQLAAQPGAQQAALQWLLRFSESDAAWGVFPELLRAAASPNVQFYAANGLYAKVCSGWTSLPPAQQAAVYDYLWGALATAHAVSVPALRRLCLALAAAAVLTRAPGTVSEYMNRALAPLAAVAASDGGGGGGAHSAVLLACVELLRGLPEEADDKPISSDRSERVRSEMVTTSDRVFGALQAVLTAPGSPFAPPAVVAVASAPPAAASGLATEGCAAAFRAVKEWLELGGVTAGTLARRFPGVLQAMLAGTLSVPVPAVAEAAGAALECAFTIRVHPREPGRDDAVASIVTALVSSTDYIQGACAAGRWDLLRPVAVTAAAIGTYEDEWLAVRGSTAPPPAPLHTVLAQSQQQLHQQQQQQQGQQPAFPFLAASLDAPLPPGGGGGSGPTVGGFPVGLGCLLGDVLLQLTAAPHHALAEVTVGALMGVQSIPPGERHPFFRRHAFRHLLRVVLQQCAYGSPPAQPPAADPDAFLAYRSSRGAAVDALIDCCAALRGDVLSVGVGWLQEVIQSSSAAAAAAHQQPDLPGRSRAWLALESLLHCLTSVGDDIVELLEQAAAGGGSSTNGDASDDDEGGGGGGGASTDAAGVDGSVEEAVVALLLLVTMGPPAADPRGFPELLSTACAWVGSLARWFQALPLDHALRYSTSHPFACLAGGPPFGAPALLLSPASTTSGAVDASFGTLHFSALLERVVAMLLACLQRHGAASGGVPMLRSAPRRDEMAVIAGLVGSAVRGGSGAGGGAAGVSSGSGKGSDGDSDSASGGEGDDDDDGGDGGGDGAATVAWRAAEALYRLCRACRRDMATSPALLHSLSAGIEGAMGGAGSAGSGLHLTPSDKAFGALVAVCSAIAEPDRREAAFAAVTAPAIGRLGVAAAAAAAAANSAAALPSAPAAKRRGPSPQELALCREVALATSALKSPFLEPLQQQHQQSPLSPGGGSVGSGGGGPPPHPLDALGDAVWRACEVALPPLYARPDTVGVLLQGLRGVVRHCPRVLTLQPGRVPSLLSLGVQLFTSRLYPDALCAVVATMEALPGLLGAPADALAGGTAMPADVLASCRQLMAAVTASTAAAAGLPAPAGTPPPTVPLADEPEALREYLRLLQCVLDVAPAALLGEPAAPPQPPSSASVLPLVLQLVGACVSPHDREGCKLGADVVRTLLTRDALRCQPGWAAAVDAGMAAACPALVRALLGALTDEAGGPVTAVIIEQLQLLFTTYGGTGAAAGSSGIVALAAAALEDLAAASAAAASAAAAGGGGGGGGAPSPSSSPTAGPDAETGIACLSPGERAALMAAAAACLAPGGATGKGHAPQRFRMLLTDLAKIARRQLTKDALLTYAM